MPHGHLRTASWRGCGPFLAVAVGAVVDVYRIGDSGAKAAWQDNYSKTATR
ncbi:hypothetical protein ACRAWF_04100 [Streptomyces sp. L7]